MMEQNRLILKGSPIECSILDGTGKIIGEPIELSFILNTAKIEPKNSWIDFEGDVRSCYIEWNRIHGSYPLQIYVGGRRGKKSPISVITGDDANVLIFELLFLHSSYLINNFKFSR